ncbi:MAG: DUF6216 family protein [Luteibacter sp.]|uniref:DUF6216 family protein n=1 Tax=Luteibacter sp. TaxID=1886636 RepID=UPI002808DF94|nr:DUF6216 family protein [Luteibacter sp.]MDQ7996915.1 DUF6216 family protein [Luteibacter sp.]MDQ8049287.1 DUF6216 family protein [Luteibacter sp.]
MDLSTLPDIVKGLSYFSPVVIAALLIWATVRSRSLYPLRERLWRLTHRRPGTDREWLAGPLRDREELLKFRVLFMWADSLPEARRVAAWADQHGVDLGTLGDCGHLFDRKTLAVADKVPSPKAEVLVLFLGMGFAGLLFLAGGLGVLKQNAVMSLKSNGHWIEFTETSAWPFWGHRAEAMTWEDCKAAENRAQFKDDDDRKVACEILNDPKLPSAVNKAIRSQRGVGLMLIFYGLFIGTPVYRWALRARSARAVHDELGRSTIQAP